MSKSPHRSFAKIRKTDLARLVPLAKKCLDEMLKRSETGQYYSANRVLMACLCQGAAQHFVYVDRGVSDWDIVFFFRSHSRWKFPPRWRGTADFGPSRFGRNPDDGPKYSGRRIDVMGRDIPVLKRDSAETAIIRYVSEGRTTSARHWAKRPMVVLSPLEMLGRVIWEGEVPGNPVIGQKHASQSKQPTTRAKRPCAGLYS
jgi:hypothetical protein